MELLHFLQTKVYLPISTALLAFYREVLVPLWNSLIGWTDTYLPWYGKFAEYVTLFFKFRHKGRIYAFMLLVPVLLILLLISIMKKRKRRRRRKKYADRKRSSVK